MNQHTENIYGTFKIPTADTQKHTDLLQTDMAIHYTVHKEDLMLRRLTDHACAKTFAKLGAYGKKSPHTNCEKAELKLRMSTTTAAILIKPIVLARVSAHV